ncbi:MAG: hypothetical protein ACRCYT_01055 [Cetobacterium sp.]
MLKVKEQLAGLNVEVSKDGFKIENIYNGDVFITQSILRASQYIGECRNTSLNEDLAYDMLKSMSNDLLDMALSVEVSDLVDRDIATEVIRVLEFLRFVIGLTPSNDRKAVDGIEYVVALHSLF